MRRAITLVMVLGFLAASFPAALWADDGERALHSPKQLSRRHSAEDGRPRKPLSRPTYARPGLSDYDGKRLPPFVGNRPAKPGYGFKPPYKRPPRQPQWSLGINDGRVRLRYDHYSRYDGCPPYCAYDVYTDAYREEENRQTKYFPTGEPPEEPTYFQGGGSFERMEEEAAAPPSTLGGDNSQADLETYRLMMKAWQ